MTTTRTIRLACDRCSAEVTHDDADGHRPRDWERFALSNAERGMQLDGDLCPSCACTIVVALRPPDAPPPPPPPVKHLSLTIEDRRIAVAAADVVLRDAILEAVSDFDQRTQMQSADRTAGIFEKVEGHAEALVDQILARMKELPHG